MPEDSNRYKKLLWILIAAGFVFRSVIAAVLELGNDESYYWLYSQQLQWNYFDHPPLIALWIRMFTLNLMLHDHELILRLGSIAGCAFSTWFIYQTVTLLHTPRAGFLASCLYNASFYAGLTAGLYLMPDAPQMVFWTFCLWMIARICNNENKWNSWLLFGMGAGLCMMSKIHGVFLWGGLGLYTVFFSRAWLLKPQFYISLLISLIIISPILFWNIAYDFATYRFHSQRVSIPPQWLSAFSLHKEIIHQFSFNNPFNVVLIIAASIAWLKKKITNHSAISVYNFIGWPLALSLLFFSVFRDTILIHWSGPAYVSLIPLAAIYLANISKQAYPLILRVSLSSFVVILIIWSLAVHYYPGTWGSRQQQDLGYGDISLDLYGWQQAGKEFDKLYQAEIKAGLAPTGTPVVCGYWWGAHVEYYFCRPSRIPMLGLGTMNKLHQYFWLNDERKQAANMQVAYCIMPSDEKQNIPSDYYNKTELISTIEIKRSGVPVHNFLVYKLSGWKGVLPVINK